MAEEVDPCHKGSFIFPDFLALIQRWKITHFWDKSHWVGCVLEENSNERGWKTCQYVSFKLKVLKTSPKDFLKLIKVCSAFCWYFINIGKHSQKVRRSMRRRRHSRGVQGFWHGEIFFIFWHGEISFLKGLDWRLLLISGVLGRRRFYLEKRIDLHHGKYRPWYKQSRDRGIAEVLRKLGNSLHFSFVLHLTIWA